MYNNPYQYGPMGYNYGPAPDQLAQLRQQQTIQPMQPMQQQPAQQPATGINWVQGEEGARAWMVGPGSTALLMDSDGSSFYLKSADASGMPQPLRIFDYVERVQAPKTPVQAAQAPAVQFVTREEFDALAAELEALKAKKCTCKVKKEDADNG